MNIKRYLQLHITYHCMQIDFLFDSIATFLLCEYSRQQSTLEKANYYISGRCDRETRICFLKITQRYTIFKHLVLLATICIWFALFTFALSCNIKDGCNENVILSSCILFGISLTLIPWGKEFCKLIREYKSIESTYSFGFLDL